MNNRISKLNDQFGIANQLKVVQKNNDITLIEINSVHAKATISMHGGQVLSFRPLNQTQDLLFVSTQAKYEPGKAIRGGIPICWPWFGPDPNNIGPAHGLVRTREWQLRHTAVLADGAIKIILGIQDNDETRRIWPNIFDLSIIITIHQALSLELISHNTGVNPFEITQALHSYFKVGDSQHIQVTGLENKLYIDKTDGEKEKQQTSTVTISQETDRIYQGLTKDLVLTDKVLSRKIHITSKNSNTAIVWNPWIKKAAAMNDMGDEEYKKMVCIETAKCRR